MGKNSSYKSPHSRRKHRFNLSSIDVHFKWSEASATRLTMSPEEAFNVMMMPAFEDFITSLVPNYEPSPDELPEMPEE